MPRTPLDGLRQGDLRQGDLRQDDLRQDDLRQDDLRQDDLRQDDLRQAESSSGPEASSNVRRQIAGGGDPPGNEKAVTRRKMKKGAGPDTGTSPFRSVNSGCRRVGQSSRRADWGTVGQIRPREGRAVLPACETRLRGVGGLPSDFVSRSRFRGPTRDPQPVGRRRAQGVLSGSRLPREPRRSVPWEPRRSGPREPHTSERRRSRRARSSGSSCTYPSPWRTSPSGPSAS
uniref:Pentapeptide repeat-containing protein n=1 Tax=Schlesneria paludicola TaxID=360056 RepID=A0A7C4QS10_9PLAN